MASLTQRLSSHLHLSLVWTHPLSTTAAPATLRGCLFGRFVFGAFTLCRAPVSVLLTGVCALSLGSTLTIMQVKSMQFWLNVCMRIQLVLLQSGLNFWGILLPVFARHLHTGRKSQDVLSFSLSSGKMWLRAHCVLLSAAVLPC